MADRGLGLRRRLTSLVPLTLLVASVQMLAAPSAHATPPSGNGVAWTDGEEGTGPAPFPTNVARAERALVPTARWGDLEADDRWAKIAIDHVAGAHDWMRDIAPDQNGNWRFRPDALESRARWARAIVKAFAPDEAPDPSVTFSDLDVSDPSYRWAAVAVGHGWMGSRADGGFHPGNDVSARGIHRSLIRALGMGPTAAALNRLSTTDGYRFATPRSFGTDLLAMRLGLRFNNKVDESQDVTPGTKLPRKQVAWSLYRATTLEDWVVRYLEDQYADMALPKMSLSRRAIVDWGVRYVGYPYIWGGEWGFETASPPAFGGQPGPGFDCSGLSWWALREDDTYWDISPPRPYRGWSLPQRTSAEMARMAKVHLHYADLLPGDLMFYDGDNDGTVDHVDVFVGNGWALDSSSSVGGVTLMWVKRGWYRDHFVHGRRVLPKPAP